MLRIGVRRIKDPRLISPTIKRRDVVTRKRTPVNLTGREIGPAFDPGEQTLDAWAIAMNEIARCAGIVLEPCAVLIKHWDQILCTREDVDVRFFSVKILRKTLISFASDRRKGKAPS